MNPGASSLRNTGLAAGALLFSPAKLFAAQAEAAADYTLHIKAAPIEIAPKQILSTITYNGQFPGPLIRFKEGRQVTVDIFNETNTSEQLHWHGQFVSTDVDGAAEEGTPYVPRTANAASRSRPSRLVCASITRTIALGPIFPRANTAARLDPFTSSRRKIPAATIAKFFWF